MLVIFLLYGLSFFLLGFAILVFPKKGSAFRFAAVLPLLGTFGILHGLNEWIDMFLLMEHFSASVALKTIRTILLPLSFAFLILFSLKIVFHHRKGLSALVYVIPVIVLSLWVGIVAVSPDRFLMGDIWARYLLGFPGIALTAVALVLQSSRLHRFHVPKVMWYLNMSAAAFTAYAIIAGLVVPRADFFPASVLQYDAFARFFGVPVQVFRSLCAVVITYCMIRVLDLFSWETQEGLRKSREELEKRVAERTAHLIVTNTQLQQEIIGRKRIEADLRESEKRFRQLVDQAADAIYVHDCQGNISDVNKKACEDLHYTREELLNRSIFDIDKDLDREKTMAVWERMAPGSRITVSKTHQRKNGTTFPVETSATLIEWGGERSLLALVRDITERKKVEEQLFRTEKLESLGIIAGGLAHDFNNLLTSILGNISLAKAVMKRRSKTFERLEEAEKASLRARDLTQQLLTFSKGGSPVKKPIDVSDVIHESSSFALRGSQVNCDISVPTDVWPVSADAGQVSQVLHNLIINADQAMPHGGTISVMCENVHIPPDNQQLLLEGDYVKISVQDEGIGIPEEQRKEIFEPFFTTKEGGSGLGLATSYSIIKNHQGTITVESGRDRGTTFQIYLPASHEPLAQVPHERVQPISGQGRVLLMDDEELVRNVARDMLQHLGYEVVCATDGADAIARYREAQENGRRFDAIIMDLTIPGGMGGKKTIRKLLELDPSVRAIVSSGYSNDPIMADFKNYGFCGVVEKPYKIEELSSILDAVIKANELRP